MKSFLRFASWPIICGILLAIIILQRFPGSSQPQYTPQISEGLTSQGQLITSFADAVERAAPSVVNIHTSRTVRRRKPSHWLLDDPLLERLFNRPKMPEQERLASSLGSGVIIDKNGYLLTNFHVIRGSDEIRVALRDGRETEAQIVGVDPESDVAVLKIDLVGLPEIPIAAEERPRIGDIVLAIGNPFGFGQTVTQGIVSATGRSQLGLTTYENFIQTDAAINPGNSGGALINLKGELIGLNTAIFSKSGESLGIGFAIPAQVASKIQRDIVAHGYVVRGYLGLDLRRLSDKDARFLNLEHTNGLIVTGILPDGPADKAGLTWGDVILSINGESIQEKNDAMNAIAKILPGQRAAIQVFRRGKKVDLEAVAVERPRI